MESPWQIHSFSWLIVSQQHLVLLLARPVTQLCDPVNAPTHK
jgi:hypothetical protein